jgi:vacuolar-type H+-ATPase subunit H
LKNYASVPPVSALIEEARDERKTTQRILKAMERARKLRASSPKKARSLLREEGVLTASGKLTARYRAKR